MWAILLIPAIVGVWDQMPKSPPNHGVKIYYSERKETPKISQIDYGYFEEER